MMLPTDVIGVFFLASVALGLAPGPDNIFVLTHSALYGRRAGFVVTLGLCTGLLFHTSVVALGVAAIFQASTLAFTLLKLIGAGYLLYLAWHSFRAGSSELTATGEREVQGLKLYRRGIIMNLTNPKVAMFFLAFLPQFADPIRGSLPLQIASLGVLFIVATLLVFGLVAWGAGYIGQWLKRSPWAHMWMGHIAGAVFVGLALRLVSVER